MYRVGRVQAFRALAPFVSWRMEAGFVQSKGGMRCTMPDRAAGAVV